MLPAIPGLEQAFRRVCPIKSSPATSNSKATFSSSTITAIGRRPAPPNILADKGCRVYVIAPHSLIGEDIESGTRTLFYRRAAIKRIRLRPNTLLMEVGDHRAKVAVDFQFRQFQRLGEIHARYPATRNGLKGSIGSFR